MSNTELYSRVHALKRENNELRGVIITKNIELAKKQRKITRLYAERAGLRNNVVVQTAQLGGLATQVIAQEGENTQLRFEAIDAKRQIQELREQLALRDDMLSRQ